VLYLENNLAANGVYSGENCGVKTCSPRRRRFSLENSRLYRELQEREAKIKRLVDANIGGC